MGELTKEELQATRFYPFRDAFDKGRWAGHNERYLYHLAEQTCLMDDAIHLRELSSYCRLYIVTNGMSRVQGV